MDVETPSSPETAPPGWEHVSPVPPPQPPPGPQCIHHLEVGFPCLELPLIALFIDRMWVFSQFHSTEFNSSLTMLELDCKCMFALWDFYVFGCFVPRFVFEVLMV